MTEIKIWSNKEIKLYDQPPIFNSIQRKKFLTLPVKLKKRVSTFYTTVNKVGFHLMYGYFKARSRFFLPTHFTDSDIQFICKRLQINSDDLDLLDYNRKTYNRHRKIILEYFGYAPFKIQTHPSYYMLQTILTIAIRKRNRVDMANL